MKWIETLVKIRKESVDSLEREVALHNARLSRAQSVLSTLREDYRHIQIPQSSNGAMLGQVSLQRKFAQNAIKEQEQKLFALQQKLAHAKEALQEANKELEQAKFIEADHVKKELQQQKRREQRFLDEISSQRFYINQREDG